MWYLIVSIPDLCSLAYYDYFCIGICGKYILHISACTLYHYGLHFSVSLAAEKNNCLCNSKTEGASKEFILRKEYTVKTNFIKLPAACYCVLFYQNTVLGA